MLVVATGAASQPVLSVIAMVVVVNVIALFSTWPAALGTAVVCWFLHDGFVLGRHGDLALVGQAGHDALVIRRARRAGARLAVACRIDSRAAPARRRLGCSASPRPATAGLYAIPTPSGWILTGSLQA
ncbi:hypothetical protein [Lentzea aerocolonigenes]|uniref:hypothetical protein n=1 Tax=Lentzea aerocolonigenes TaxID=68170 RepID=UPI000AFC71CC|nr:hypothetical protein [Lentzea aerocolonigenes]